MGTIRNSSIPGLSFRARRVGIRCHTITPAVPNSGSSTNMSSTGTTTRSISGARYKPATNPMTTLGSAAMISTVGFSLARIEGWTNCEMYNAPSTASGIAKRSA